MGLLFLFLFLFQPAADPTPILLLNPSFEDPPAPGTGATGWYHCGRPRETPPDIHPSSSFQVFTEPFHGQSYAGMVVRDNGTYEAMGQRLATPLRGGRCYSFSLALARSSAYSSFSATTGFKADYNQAVVLRIWGSDKTCEHSHLLAQSQPVEHEDWKTYSFSLKPEVDIEYFFLEAYYPDPENKRGYMGNILLDDCSPLFSADCVSGDPERFAERVYFQAPQDFGQLKRLVQEESPKINFVPGTAALTSRYYEDDAGTRYQGNLGLHRIAYAVNKLEGSRLTLVVDLLDRTQAVKAFHFLSRQLDNLGLSHDQFEVRIWRRSDQKVEWDAFNAEKDLYFAVSR